MQTLETFQSPSVFFLWGFYIKSIPDWGFGQLCVVTLMWCTCVFVVQAPPWPSLCCWPALTAAPTPGSISYTSTRYAPSWGGCWEVVSPGRGALLSSVTETRVCVVVTLSTSPSPLPCGASWSPSACVSGSASHQPLGDRSTLCIISY